MSLACICALRWMTAIACSGSRTTSPLASMLSQPRMAFIGVRSSWLKVARNSSLMRLWRSASSRAPPFVDERQLARLLRPALGADVAADADDLLDAAMLVVQHASPLRDPHVDAVGTHDAVFALVGRAGVHRRVDGLLHALRGRRGAPC